MNTSLLFRFLSRCNETEKRYISRKLKEQGKSKKYRANYGKVLNGEKISPKEAEYLFRWIVRILEQYKHSLKTPVSYEERKNFVKHLTEKGLLREALEQIELILRETSLEMSEKLYWHIQKNKLLYLTEPTRENISVAIKENRKILQQVREIYLFENNKFIAVTVAYFFKKIGFPRLPKHKKKFRKLMEKLKIPTPQNTKTQIYYYHTKGVGNLLLFDLKKALKNFRKLINIVNQSSDFPPLAREHLLLSARINLLNCFYYLNEQEEFIRTSEKIINYLNKNSRNFLLNSDNGAFINIFLAFQLKNYDPQILSLLADAFQEKYATLIQKIHPAHHYEIYLTLILLFFLLGNKKITAKLLGELQNMNKTYRRLDLKLTSELLQLLIVFEDEENQEYINHFITKLYYRYVTQKKENFPLEQLFISYIRRYIVAPESHKKGLLAELLQEFEAKQKQYPYEYSYFYIFPMKEYLTGKIERKNFRDFLPTASAPARNKQVENFVKGLETLFSE